MRTTKTLLLATAVSAVGIAAVQAQVYSVNVVGFVNKDLKAGFNFIANPLNGTNNMVSTIFAGAPDGTIVQAWDQENQVWGTGYTYGFGAWDPDGNLVVDPGQGLLVQVGADARVTFVGEVPQGAANATNKIYGNYSFKSSIVPQAGLLVTDLQYSAKDGDIVSQWDPVAQQFLPGKTYGFGAWDPSEPTIEIGEAFFLQRDPAQADPSGWWVRNFTVN